MSDVALGLFKRMQMPALARRYNSTLVLGLFALINGFISIGLMSLAALVTDEPLIFPSLGPTAFLLFYTPRAPAASPRNTLIGHLIGASAGYLALVLFGLTDTGPALVEGVTLSRTGAAALSLGLTAGVMAWVRAPHPPAGATTLIVSLGILTEPSQLAILMLAVILLVLQGFIINRAAGINYPVWSPLKE
jgi:CBS-domain-containing membrane protein